MRLLKNARCYHTALILGLDLEIQRYVYISYGFWRRDIFHFKFFG